MIMSKNESHAGSMALKSTSPKGIMTIYQSSFLAFFVATTPPPIRSEPRP